jgi:hypothetical protein
MRFAASGFPLCLGNEPEQAWRRKAGVGDRLRGTARRRVFEGSRAAVARGFGAQPQFSRKCGLACPRSVHKF